MAALEDDETPDDPFTGQPGRCPQCGEQFPTTSDNIDEWSYAYAVKAGEERAEAQGRTFFRSRCGACDTPIWAPGTGCHTRAECDPATVVWWRDRNAHLIFGG